MMLIVSPLILYYIHKFWKVLIIETFSTVRQSKNNNKVKIT